MRGRVYSSSWTRILLYHLMSVLASCTIYFITMSTKDIPPFNGTLCAAQAIRGNERGCEVAGLVSNHGTEDRRSFIREGLVQEKRLLANSASVFLIQEYAKRLPLDGEVSTSRDRITVA
jgi:hypothetical protein